MVPQKKKFHFNHDTGDELNGFYPTGDEHPDTDYGDDYEDMGDIDGSLYEAPGERPLNPDPETGEPRVEIIVDPTITRAFDASNYLKGVLLRMKLSGRIEVHVNHGAIHLEILGAEPGLVIGHRGQNLDALQHLVNRMVNKDSD
ncbi:MAG TPA: KH domain-containing protein, partial [bacterium]|nr:KH domain-containing protein [bacterium]